MASSIVGLNQQIAQLDHGAKGLANPQSLLGLSYIFDDLANTTGGWERKLASIGNNIPGLSCPSEKRDSREKRSTRRTHRARCHGIDRAAPLAKSAWDAIADGKPKEALDDLADRAES